MMKIHLKKLALFLISAAGLASIAVLACGGGNWDPWEGSMFTPQIIDETEFVPFFRATGTSFYDGYDDGSAELLKKENGKDWLTYLGDKTTSEKVNYWLYEASLNQIDTMIFDIKSKPSHLTERSKENSLKSIDREKATTFLYYLGYARRNETFAALEINSWGETSVPNVGKDVFIEKQIAGGINFLSKAKDAFMKERNAYQLLRSYFFAHDYEKVISTYEVNEKYFVSTNNLKWRALSYKAGAYYRQKKYAEANYLFSKIYEGFDPLKKSAYLCFHPQQQADWVACLGMAKTIREKEVLWHLLGLYSAELTAMKEIIKLNPKSEFVDVLLTRAVNLEEEKFEGTLKMDGNETSSLPKNLNKELVNFVNEMSATTTSSKPEIWHLSAAYLNYLNRNHEVGDKQLKRAESYIGKSSLVKAQFHLISLVGKMGRIKDNNANVEKDLLLDLEALFDTPHPGSFRADYAKMWMREVLAKLADKSGEHLKAELICPEKSKLALTKVEEIDRMIAYYDKKDKSGYENLFFKKSSLSKQDYIDLKAIRYAQNDKLEEALRIFKAQVAENIELAGNPFTIHIRDCHECDHAAVQKTHYNRITFIEKLIEMRNTATAKPAEAAQNYFLMANGFYNMTHFGNARLFYANNLVDGNFYYYDETALPEKQGDIALKYYLLAKKSSTDKEFKAKCTFMAAKCELNAYFYNRLGEAKEDFKSGVYFASLKSEYSDTKYYREVIKECGYFRTYLNK